MNGDGVDEGVWTSITDDDEVWAAPVDLPPPLADPAPPLLNTHELTWDAFEGLVLAIVRALDGAYDVRRYGKLGQAQHGLDVVGFFTERQPSVYQAKRWEAFGAADLERAVELYAAGRRPFDADRMVVAVASEVRDTQTIERLAELRATYSNIDLELWDRQAISDRLRNQSHIVSTFFGAATAAAFCTVAPVLTVAAPPASIAADAILRGPVAHLGLADDLRRAEDWVETRPVEAADLLAHVAERLETSGFAPHATSVRELQAKALRAAGHRVAEAWIRITLGWGQLGAGDTFSASVQAREVTQWSGAPANIIRCASALSVAIGLRRAYPVTVDNLAEVADALIDGDPFRVEAYLMLAEEAVAARRPDLVEARSDLLDELARLCPQDSDGPLMAARLRMCVADCCGEWEQLAETARETYPPGVTALVLARHARQLALGSKPQASLARWRDAVERACVEGLNDDASDWLYALRAVKVQTGLIGDDLNDSHRHAQALRAAGRGTLLPEPYGARERVQANLRDEKWPDALESLRRYLWRSVVGADWSGEIEAHELLGDLLVRTGRGLHAIRHYVIAGAIKKLENLAGSIPEEPVSLPIDLLSARPWERAAAFSFAAATADLIPDDEAYQWCAAAFDEFANHPAPPLAFAPNPWLAAFKAFGQLAVLARNDQARRFLEISREMVPRAPDTYRFTDEDHVHALIGIARSHPQLRGDVLDELLQALLVDTRMAGLVLAEGQDLLRGDPTRVVAAVGGAAAGGSHYAALALVVADADTTVAVPLARQRLEAAVAPRVHEPGVRGFGTGLPQVTALMMALTEDDQVRFARGMLNFASDHEETAPNRMEALYALQGIAQYLPDDVRDELFDLVLPFADGQQEPDNEDPFFAGGDDPLAHFRFSFGDVSLAPAGLLAAAALARTPGQYSKVERNGVAQMRTNTDHAANAIAAALATMPPESVSLPVQILASHPSRWLRVLAAVLWAQRDDEPEEIGVALAQDTSPQVRLSLAAALRPEARHDGIRASMSTDPRRSVRQQLTSGA
jgi:hypothetical protein